eukprot:scaffold5337_cov411-Prasinococcus_capsulatus_cf.AAC.11
MKKSRRSQWKLTRNTASPAITQFLSKRLQTGKATDEGMYFFTFKPLTGKTHQLRVASKALGAPIAGDLLYAAADDARREERTYLHAFAVRVQTVSGPLEVVCQPRGGSLWQLPAVHDYIDEICATEVAVPGSDGPSQQDGTRVWFPKHSLLRSSLPPEANV